MQQNQHRGLYIIMIIGMASWGLSWTNGKILGEYTSVPVLMFWRFLIAGLSMIPVLIFTGKDWRVNRLGAVKILGSSILLVAYNYFYFTGTHEGHAGAGGVLVTTLNPVFTFILVLVIHRERPNGRALLGILLGIFGGSIIVNLWGHGWDAVFSRGNQYFLMCATSWAFLTLISSGINKQVNTLTYSLWLYLSSSALAYFMLDHDETMVVFQLDWVFWMNMLSVSVGAMAFATTAYFIATSRLGSNKAAAFIFTVPVSAMLFSMWILDEPLKTNVLLGGIFSITAVYMINSAKKIKQIN